MKKLTFFFCLMLVLIPAILAGCTPGIGAGTVPTNLHELSFTDMWNKVVNATGINEASACIADFTLHIGKNNSLDALYFAFCGSDTAGKSKMYFVDIDTTGGIRTHSYSADVIDINRQTINPGVLFNELDKAGLAVMFSPNNTTYIVSNCEAGAVLFSNDFAKLYLLNEAGKLISLKQIMFRSTIPWFALSIFNMPEGAHSGSISQMWFLSQDLGKATDIEYTETPEPGFGIYLVDTGELVISDEHIESYNASTHEIALNEAGIEKWNSYITGVIPTLDKSLFSKEFVVKVNGEEIYSGVFWSMVSSQSYDGIVILDALFILDNEFNKIRIDNGYPAPNSSDDPTNDSRITDFFESAGLLK